VLGVALIQALCAGVAFMLVGIPAAALWALLCFILAVVQLGVLPVVGPLALYALFTMDLVVAVPFALWCGFVGLIDSILKPLLLHHGMRTPLWVIALGSIGGLVTSGVVGLFIGPVLRVLAYELGRVWPDEAADSQPHDGATSRSPPSDP
jgi:predicted PurR-regulated permease PerM